VVSKGPADGAGEIVGNGLVCYKELYLGGWEKRNSTDEVGKGAQLGGYKFVGVTVELGWKR
jgi:hypothetical protein